MRISRHHNYNLRKLFLNSKSLILPGKRSGNRELLISITLLLTLILAFFLLRSSYSYLSLHEPQVYHGAFAGRRFLGTDAVMQVLLEPGTRDEVLHCDRSHLRTDVCVARGDVRVVGGQKADQRLYEVVVYAEDGQEREERVKPYTRKWEDDVMSTIDEVKLLRKLHNASDAHDQHDYPTCEVQHAVPAILFSTGGYTGNVYHEFNDGLIPLFITAQQYAPAGQVVLVLLEYHDWWISKYAEILGRLTNYTIIDLATDKRVHCFSEVTVGLRIHDELSIDPEVHAHGASMEGFQSMLHAAYLPRLSSDRFDNVSHSERPAGLPHITNAYRKPKLVIISRDGPRALLNQQEVVVLAEEIGFAVQVLSPTPTTEMVEIYEALNGCDVMMGVHGAAMTHVLFMRAGATFIQVVPLGTDWAATTYYGEPARKMGLKYVEYKVSPQESSLWEQYASDDPVLVNPDLVNSNGWWETKRIYLQGQNVTVSLAKMGVTLRSAYARAAS